MSESHPFKIVVDDQDALATLKGFPGPLTFHHRINGVSWLKLRETKCRVFAFKTRADLDRFRYMLNMLDLNWRLP